MRNRVFFYLPFINAPPSNYDTIFTVLTTAVEKSKSLGENRCIITFDQPLYHKARNIIACSTYDSDLRSIILRIGRFSTLLLFLGARGYIIDGSGLKFLIFFKAFYADLWAGKILNGHACSRAVRGHLLVYFSLGNIFFSSTDLTEQGRQEVEDILLMVGRKHLSKNCLTFFHKHSEQIYRSC